MDRVSKPRTAWGITYVGRSEQVALHSIRETRKKAINAWVDGDTWAYWKSRGCEAVKVTVALATANRGEGK